MGYKAYKRGKLSFQNYLLIFSLVSVLILILILSCIYYLKAKDFIEEQRQQSIQVRIDQISNEIQTSFKNVYYTINNLKTNEIVIQSMKDLSNNDLSSFEKYSTLRGLEDYLYTNKQDNLLIDNILIVTPDSQYSSNRKYIDDIYNDIKMKTEVENEDHFVSIGEAEKTIEYPKQFKASHEKTYILHDLNKKMFFGANLKAADGSHQGVILVFINLRHLEEYIFYSDHIALFDAHNTMFFKGSQFNTRLVKEFKKHKFNEKDLFIKSEDAEVYKTIIPYYNFKLIYSEQLNSYKERIQQMWKIIGSTMLFAVIVTLFSSRIISRKVLQPIYNLLSSIQSYKVNRNNNVSFENNENRHFKISLRERFFFYFLITILLPLLFFVGIYYWQTSKVVSKDLQEGFRAVHEKLAHIVNNEINQRELIMAQLSLNTNLQNNIMDSNAKKITNGLLDITQSIEVKDINIAIYNQSRKLLYSNSKHHPNHLDGDFYKTLKKSNREISYHLKKDRFDNVTIVLGMPIYSPSDFSKMIGFITTEIENSYLIDFYSDWKKPGFDMFIIDNQDRIVSHQDPSTIGEMDRDEIFQKNKITRSDQHVFRTNINGVDWNFISKYNYSDVQKQVNQLFLSDLYFIFIILLLLLVFSYWISKRMLKPLGQLNELFNLFDFKGSHHAVLETLSGIDEVDLLSRNFNKMIDRIDELIHETLKADQERIQLKYEKRELQVNALQSQIKPHFLYNTLDNLIYLVESKETDKSVEMIYSLSKLFRFITNRERSTIDIRDEIAYTKTYVEIMSHRFDNFQCVWDIDEKVLNFKTIKLILQPVIENAIQHGAKITKKSIKIEVTCRMKEEMIEFIIKDNAAGITEERLIEVKEQLASAAIEKVGIYNVNTRIQLNYGNKYGLSIDSETGKWTKVIILIPSIQ